MRERPVSRSWASRKNQDIDDNGTSILPFPPECKRLIINIGSWKDPPVLDDTGTYTIAVEAMLKTAATIKAHPRLFVITAAISGQSGLAPFFAYGDGLPGSSSLSEAKDAHEGWTKVDSDVPPVSYVPTLTLKTLLDSIPKDIQIILLKTDTQGWDDVVLRSAGGAIRRVQVIQSEVMCPSNQQYDGVRNTWALVNEFLSMNEFVDIAGDKCLSGDAKSYHDALFVSKNCEGPFCGRSGPALQLHNF